MMCKGASGYLFTNTPKKFLSNLVVFCAHSTGNYSTNNVNKCLL